LDPDGPLPEECCLTVHGQEIVGRVTSVTRSAATAAIIGLAYVQPEQTTIGERFEIKLARGAGRISAEVAARPFYDPDNSRQKL
jgi:sarcosine oxidase subunit alpha